jgi:hypothetical protein
MLFFYNAEAMLMTLLLTFLLFLSVIVLMAIGVMFKRKSIQGSCGGLSAIQIERECNCEVVCDSHKKSLYQITEPSQADSLSDK